MYREEIERVTAISTREGLEYFRELLTGYEGRAELPSYGTVPEAERGMDDVDRIIPSETVAAFKEVCRRAGANLANGLELIWALTLMTLCRLEDVVFAKVVSGRDNTGLDITDIAGLFMNSLPVRVMRNPQDTMVQILANLH